MKPLIFILLFLFIGGLNAQNFHFPDSAAVWPVLSWKYYISGDSVYNNMNYKKINFTYDSTLQTGYVRYLLREDTLKRQVFYLDPFDNIDKLLYDFSLSENDTVTIYNDPIGSVALKVDSIDQILIAGQQRKLLKLSPVNNFRNRFEYWIEGIGSSKGLFESGFSSIIAVDIPEFVLLCFHQDGELLYKDTEFNSCYLSTTHINSLKPELTHFNFYPNPVIHNLQIEADNIVTNYLIRSITGEVILVGNPETNNFNIDVSYLQAGTYILSLQGVYWQDNRLFNKIN